MSTLADELLADFEGLDEAQEETTQTTTAATVHQDNAENKIVSVAASGKRHHDDGTAASKLIAKRARMDGDAGEMDVDDNGHGASSSESEGTGFGGFKSNNSNNKGKQAMSVKQMHADLTRVGRVGEVAMLWDSDVMRQTMEAIDRFSSEEGAGLSRDYVGSVEDHPEYETIVTANGLAVEIENELHVVHKFIRDLYAKRFPELESLVLNPLDYARTVRTIQNNTAVHQLTALDVQLRQILTSATVMIITVTASTLKGAPLTATELDAVLEGGAMMERLDEARARIVDYVTGRMGMVAPNLSKVVGATCAALLMGAAGGLLALSKVPSCNLLGATKKQLAGMSTADPNRRTGHLHKCELIERTLPEFRIRAIRVLSGKACLAARIDAAHESPDGAIGAAFRAEIEKKLDKWQEPPPTKDVKALAAPEMAHKKVRGGKRARKLKEQFAITELQRQQNRMGFNVAEDEVLNFDRTEGLGMVGKSLGGGRVRATVADARVKLGKSKGPQPVKTKGAASRAIAASGGSGATSGLSSSLVFTPVQGLELVDPEAQRQAQEERLKQVNDRWFAANAGYANVKK